uniref:Uncharacterized protein n=1 Tax=Arundo donax TaxID=35708 RepID=A0A0A9AJQ1_ARUDO
MARQLAVKCDWASLRHCLAPFYEHASCF